MFRRLTTRPIPSFARRFSVVSSPASTHRWVRNSMAIGFSAVVGYGLYANTQPMCQAVPGTNIVNVQPGDRRDDLPEFSASDISKHKDRNSRVWVVYKEGVYDVTDFTDSHPGGDKILLAAGGSIEPFWTLYAVHKSKETFEMLEEMRIGNVRKSDLGLIAAQTNDPFKNEPNRHDKFIVRAERPFNAEPPLSVLADSWITPSQYFYVRNHLPVPKVDISSYVLEVTGENMKPIRLTLDELKTRFPQYEFASVVQCAGNRRNEISKIKPVKGLDWGQAAIGNALWKGVKLRDVLEYAGMKSDAGIRHIQFEGLDKDFTQNYGASIPVERAIDPNGDVLLAWQMNGEDIPIDHGFPVRLIVPGTVGARNVKWLSKIVASKEESPSFWQRVDYKGLPNADPANIDPSRTKSIQDLPVQSAICYPESGSRVDSKDGKLHLKGYAWSGGGRGILRVDVSLDGGKTWQLADLKEGANQPYKRAWAWTLWQANVSLPADHRGPVDVVCRAVDDSYNIQPESMAPLWNARGYLGNAWHKVQVVRG
eukprot:GILK01005221.1.p1 GENE.GILK01005221.1~~GILK01005221.1.p1  ORF type:complete len:538 (-),score=56.30 GILK01005221.1:125-1738(-)